MDMETTVMELIIHAGEARSCSMQALRAARSYDWQEADAQLAAAGAAAKAAHKIQTALIGADEGVGKVPVNLILVHAQDHAGQPDSGACAGPSDERHAGPRTGRRDHPSASRSPGTETKGLTLYSASP